MSDTFTPAEGTVAAAFAKASLEAEAPSTLDEAPAGGDTAVTTEPVSTDSYTLKVGGEERLVNRDELIRLAQQGDDYTRKTQALAADRQRLTAAETLLEQLREDPQGTLQQLAQHYQLDFGSDDGYEELDPEEQRIVDLDRRVAAFEEDARQRAIQATVDSLRQQYGDFDELELVNHAIKIGTSDLQTAFRDMRFEQVYSEAQAARDSASAEADEQAVERKRQAQVVSGGSNGTANAAPAPSTTKRSVSDILKEALLGA